MELKDQVTNEIYSGRLKELGVPQKSLIFWKVATVKNKPVEYLSLQLADGLDITGLGVSAFTPSELGKFLPTHIVTDDMRWLVIQRSDDLTWIVDYGSDDADPEYEFNMRQFEDESLANAMARCLIYLIESGLVSFAQRTKTITKKIKL